MGKSAGRGPGRDTELVEDIAQVPGNGVLANAEGGGNLRLRSGDGMVRVKLGATADGSGLILFDTDAEPAVHLAVNKTGASATLAEQGKPPKVFRP